MARRLPSSSPPQRSYSYRAKPIASPPPPRQTAAEAVVVVAGPSPSRSPRSASEVEVARRAAFVLTQRLERALREKVALLDENENLRELSARMASSLNRLLLRHDPDFFESAEVVAAAEAELRGHSNVLPMLKLVEKRLNTFVVAPNAPAPATAAPVTAAAGSSAAVPLPCPAAADAAGGAVAVAPRRTSHHGAPLPSAAPAAAPAVVNENAEHERAPAGEAAPALAAATGATASDESSEESSEESSDEQPAQSSPAATEEDKRAAYRRWFARRQAGSRRTSADADAATAEGAAAALSREPVAADDHGHHLALDPEEACDVVAELLEPMLPCVQRLEVDVLALIRRKRAASVALAQLEKVRTPTPGGRTLGRHERHLLYEEQVRLEAEVVDVGAETTLVEGMLRRGFAVKQLLEAALGSSADAPQQLFPRTVKMLKRECAEIAAFVRGEDLSLAVDDDDATENIAEGGAPPPPSSRPSRPARTDRSRGSRIVSSFVRQREALGSSSSSGGSAWLPKGAGPTKGSSTGGSTGGSQPSKTRKGSIHMLESHRQAAATKAAAAEAAAAAQVVADAERVAAAADGAEAARKAQTEVEAAAAARRESDDETTRVAREAAEAAAMAEEEEANAEAEAAAVEAEAERLDEAKLAKKTAKKAARKEKKQRGKGKKIQKNSSWMKKKKSSTSSTTEGTELTSSEQKPEVKQVKVKKRLKKWTKPKTTESEPTASTPSIAAAGYDEKLSSRLKRRGRKPAAQRQTQVQAGAAAAAANADAPTAARNVAYEDKLSSRLKRRGRPAQRKQTHVQAKPPQAQPVEEDEEASAAAPAVALDSIEPTPSPEVVAAQLSELQSEAAQGGVRGRAAAR